MVCLSSDPEGAIYGAIDGASTLVENYQAVGEALTALIATYGTYKAILIADTAIQGVRTSAMYTAEAAELSKLLTVEQSANVSKQNLAKGTAEYVAAIKAEIAAAAESAQSKLAEQQADLNALMTKREQAREQMFNSQAKVQLLKQELAQTIVNTQAEIEASLKKRMAVESEKQSRVALSIVRLQERKDAAIEQARALKEQGASAEKIAAKNREIVSIQTKIAAARQEEIQHGRNVAAARAELKAGIDLSANKTVQTATTNLNTASQQANSAETQYNALQRRYLVDWDRIQATQQAVNTAVTNANTVATSANITVTQLLTAAKAKLWTATKNLFSVLVPNPYILVAAAVIGAGYAIYKYATYTTEAEKAIVKFNEEARNQINELNGVFDAYKKANEGTEEKKKLLETIKTKYGDYIKDLIDEKGRITDIEAAQKLANKALKESIALKVRNESINDATTKEVKKQAGYLGQLRKIIAGAKGAETANTMVSKIGDIFSNESKSVRDSALEAQKYLTDAGISLDETSWLLGDSAGRVLSNIQSSVQNARNERKDIEDSFRGLVKDDSKPKTGDESTPTIISTYNDQLKSAQGNVSKLEKDLANLRKGIRPVDIKADVQFDFSKNIEEKTKELKDAQDKLSYLTTGQSYSASNKANNVAESAAEKRLEAQQWLANKQKELSNEQIKSELEYNQKVLDYQKDSFDKQRKQNELNYRKELLSVKEYEASKLKEQQEAAKKLYVSQKGSDKGFNFSTFDKSSLPVGLRKTDIDKEVKSRNKIANDSYIKSNEELVKTLTDQYKSYADQRIEIEKKYDKDIASLRSERDKATTKDQKDLLDRSIAKATTDKGQSLMSFDFDRLKESPEYVRAFEDLKNTSSETLNSLLSQLEEAKKTASTVLSPDQLREYTSTIQSIMDELVDRNPYSIILDKKKELADAERELIEAESQLNRVRSGKGVITGVVQQEGKLATIYLTEKEALLAVGKAKDKYNKSNNEVLKAQKKIYDQVNELSKSLSGLGDNIGGASGQIIGFIGNIGTFATTSMEGIEQVSQKGVLAISAVEKASVILTIISTAIQLMRELDSIIPDAFSKYEQYDEKIEQINDMRDAISDYEIAVLKAKQAEKSWFGSDSLQNLKDYKEQQEKIWEANQDKIAEEQAIYQNQSGGGWLTKTLSSAANWVSKITYGFTAFNKKYKEGTTAAIDNLRIETRKKKSGFLGSGIGGKSQKTADLQDWINQNKDQFGNLDTELFDKDGFINKDLAETIVNKYGEKLVGQTKETIEELISYKEQYDEYLNQLHEYVGSLYEPLVDNMVDSIWDWFDEGKNALDSFKDYAKDTFRDIVSDMIKTILLKDVFADFQENIAKLYEEYSKGNLTEQQLSEEIAKETSKVQDRYEKNLPAMENTVNTITDAIKDATGIDLKGSSSSQSASSGYSTSMSQDTGAAIEGRMTAMQMNLISIDGNVARIAEWAQPFDMKYNVDVLTAPLSALSESCQRIELMLEQNRNIAIQSYYELKDINKNTKELYPMRIDTQAIRKSLESL